MEADPEGEIPGLGIADLLSKYGLDRIDLLKIDIEDGERVLFEDQPGAGMAKGCSSAADRDA